MAENEILDLGNPRQYAHFRHLLATPDASTGQVADALLEDVLRLVRRDLRRAPLDAVLKACGKGRLALQEAIAALAERGMATLTLQAHTITRSTDPPVIAKKVTDLLFDRIIDRLRLYSQRHAHYAGTTRRSALIGEAEHRLNECYSEVENLVTASLQGDPVKRSRRIPGPRMSANALVKHTLVARHGSRGRPDV